MPTRMKVCNVAEYNKSLAQRGKLFSLLKEKLEKWYEKDVKEVEKTKYTYSEELISVLAAIRYVFKLPYRQLSGFISDFLTSLDMSLPVPDYTTLCRRIKSLLPKIRDYRKSINHDNEPYELLIDSTGICIYNTGGTHSKSNRAYRKYQGYDQVRKMHIGYIPQQHQISVFKMGSGTSPDGKIGAELVEMCSENITRLYADGAYDGEKIRKKCQERDIIQTIPPSLNAAIKTSKKEPLLEWQERNQAIRFMDEFDSREEGLKAWKTQEGYGKRSLVEGVFSRFKRIFGFHFMSKNETARQSELAIKLNILNSYSQFAQPIFQAI